MGALECRSQGTVSTSHSTYSISARKAPLPHRHGPPIASIFTRRAAYAAILCVTCRIHEADCFLEALPRSAANATVTGRRFSAVAIASVFPVDILLVGALAFIRYYRLLYTTTIRSHRTV